MKTIKEREHQEFQFTDASWDTKKSKILLSYAIDTDWHFTEEIIFNNQISTLSKSQQIIIKNIISSLHILAGTSYYKTTLPKRLSFNNQNIDVNQANFYKKVYENGLGEFAYRNGISLNNRIYFPYKENTNHNQPPPITLKKRSLVLIGGGKDSLVTIESLKSINEEIALLAVNPKKPILDCIKASGLPSITITRKLDPLLMKLNEQGAYNGHVPITSIISLIALIAAVIYDYDSVILSNERSASEATIKQDGIEVNHQYSKSIDFENDFKNHIKNYISPDLKYFSFLRPFSEIKIARALAKTTTYDSVFTSCNKAFKLNDPMVDKRWCGHCPKCQFVFLALATTFKKERLIKIFGKNLLNDNEQTEDYKNLSGLTGHKPWECVGEILECAAAIYYLSQNNEWKNDCIINELTPQLIEKYSAQKLNNEFQMLMKNADTHNVPKDKQRAFKWLD